MVGFLITTLVASVYGANRWFRRGNSSCASGQCSVVDVMPEPTPVVIPTPAPLPDNIVLDNTQTKKRNPKNYSDSTQNDPSTNDVLGSSDVKKNSIRKVDTEPDDAYNGYDVGWAIEQMKLGNKVRKATWPSDLYFYMDKDVVYMSRVSNQKDVFFNKNDISTNWEKYVKKNNETANDYDIEYYYPQRRGLFGRFR